MRGATNARFCLIRGKMAAKGSHLRCEFFLIRGPDGDK